MTKDISGKVKKMVAEHLKTTHHEIKLTETDFIDAIPQVIYAIESYDTTTVRASVGNYLIGKYMTTRTESSGCSNNFNRK